MVMTAADAASALYDAHKTGNPIAPIAAAMAAPSIEDAYAVQDINTERWLKQGRELTGRKIGVTAKAVQSQLGVLQPDYGMLFADMAYGDAEEIPAARLIQPKIEGEIAFYLKKDLDGGKLTMADVLSAIDYAVAAFEIVDSRIARWEISIIDTIADNASSGLYVLGSTPVKLDAFDHRLCGMVIEHRGEPVSVGAGVASLGNPLTSCLWLAKKMAAVGRPLKAGDLVLSGALGPMITVQPGETYTLRINGVGAVTTTFLAK